MSNEHKKPKELEHKSYEHEKTHIHNTNGHKQKVYSIDKQKIFIIGIAILFVGIFIGAVSGYAVAGTAQKPISSTNTSIDVAVLKKNVESYFATNSEAVFGSNNVVLTINDVNLSNNLEKLYAISFDISDGNQTQQGQFFANNQKVLIPSVIFDLNKPLPKLPITATASPTNSQAQ